jgi:hypothetical protein
MSLRRQRASQSSELQFFLEFFAALRPPFTPKAITPHVPSGMYLFPHL